MSIAPEQVTDAWGRFVARMESVVDHLPVLGIAIAIAVAFAVLAGGLSRWDAPFRLFSRSPLVRAVVRNVVATAVVLAGVLFALELLEATKIVGAVLGAAGVFGLAIGFAFKDIVENYLASVLLAVRRPFALRDHVRIAEQEGKVMSLTTRETVLMNLEGNHIRLPNALVFKSVIINYTRNPLRRFDFGVGAGTQEDLVAAQRLGMATIAATEGIAADPPPFSLIDELGDSTVTIRFHGWVDQRAHDFLRVRSEAIRRVKVAFDDAAIDIPAPTYRVAMVEAPRAGAAEHPHGDGGITVAVDDQVDRQMSSSPVDDLGENLLEREP